MGRNRSDMEGMSVQALFRLIQKKGEPIKSEEPKYNGVKAYEFANGEFIAIKRTAGPKDKFYPCAIQIILLTTL